MKVSGIITLTTDFGLTDPYVALMKGVILSINPSARIIDVTHGVEGGAILQAAFLMGETYRFFPKGSIHVAVIDPGVGTARRPILVITEDHLFVGPDNGLFWPVISGPEHRRCVHLTDPAFFLSRVSHTFHGRDIFAPVAAHLSLGVDPLRMGPAIADPRRLNVPAPTQKGDALSGRIIRSDNFGNLVSNIHGSVLERFLGNARLLITIGELRIEGMAVTYGDVEPGEPLALLGSSGYLEIAVNRGRACDLHRFGPGTIAGKEVLIVRDPGSAVK